MSPAARRLALALLLLALPPGARGAVVEGRAIHTQRPEAVAGLRVEVVGITSDPNAPPITRETRTDARGRFRFEDLPAPAAYLVRCYFQGMAFPGGTAVFRPGEPETIPPLAFHVFDRSDDAAALSLGSLQWVIEREAAVYRVSVSATVRNSGMTLVALDPNTPPALRLALPAGHGELEMPFGRLPEGVQVSGDEIEIRGPVLPGDEGLQIEFAFDLDPGSPTLNTELLFPDAVESLRLFVRDFGVVVRAAGLYPARAARQDDVYYLSFVGFDLPAGGRLPLLVEPLPAQTAPSEWAIALIVALLAGGLLFVVGRPIVEAPSAAAEAVASDERRHGDTLADALRDLEHDFETGKLSPLDRDLLREELRREAVHTLARERTLAPGRPALNEAAADGSEKPPACACGAQPSSADRFCSACGREL